jgi:2-oxoglutarate-Fe(II)-dependent oxygenase superfamily protein
MVNDIAFQDAKPFPHKIVDNMWSAEMLRTIRDEFPPPADPRWITYPAKEEVGKRAGDSRMWGPMTKQWFETVKGIDFTSFLEKLTGIYPLTAADIGGGMHMTGEGGRLEMHVDFNHHPDLPMERRINLLVFLNDEWEQEWGGTLYLGENKEVAVTPLFNRTVIFATGETSWHGHPEPIVGDHLRKSLAVYYYAPLREETAGAHTTVWLPQT